MMLQDPIQDIMWARCFKDLYVLKVSSFNNELYDWN